MCVTGRQKHTSSFHLQVDVAQHSLGKDLMFNCTGCVNRISAFFLHLGPLPRKELRTAADLPSAVYRHTRQERKERSSAFNTEKMPPLVLFLTSSSESLLHTFDKTLRSKHMQFCCIENILKTYFDRQFSD